MLLKPIKSVLGHLMVVVGKICDNQTMSPWEAVSFINDFHSEFLMSFLEEDTVLERNALRVAANRFKDLVMKDADPQSSEVKELETMFSNWLSMSDITVEGGMSVFNYLAQGLEGFVDSYYNGRQFEKIHKLKLDLKMPQSVLERADSDEILNPKRLKKMRKFLKSEGYSESLIDEIFKEIRYIDQGSYNNALRELEAEIAKFVDGEPYYIHIHSRFNMQGEMKSGEYILGNLRLPKEPIEVISENKNCDDVRKDCKIVYIDDAAYSGQQFTQEAISKIMRDPFDESWPIKPEQYMLAFIGMTTKAIDIIVDKTQITNIHAVYKMPMVGEIFSNNDEFKPILYRYKSGKILFCRDSGESMAFFWCRVPDNFIKLFRRSGSHLPSEIKEPILPFRHFSENPLWIIDDVERFWPPYW